MGGTNEDEKRKAARLGLVKQERTVRFAQESGGALSLAVGESPEIRATSAEDLLLLQAEIGSFATYLRLAGECTKALKAGSSTRASRSSPGPYPPRLGPREAHSGDRS